MAVLLLVLTNGPVFYFVTFVINQSGHWESLAVWPFFAGAAAASAALAAPILRRRAAAGPGARQLSSVAAEAAAVYSLGAVASAIWSVDGSRTLWRAVVCLGLPLLAMVVARLPASHIRGVLAAVAGFAVVVSLALVRWQPNLAIDRYDNWKGIYTNRNSLAPLAALGMIVGIHGLVAAWARRRRPGLSESEPSRPGRPQRPLFGKLLRPLLNRGVLSGTLAALSAVTMIGSRSRTAWFALALALFTGTLPVIHLRLRRRLHATAAAAITAGLAAAGAAAGLAAVALAWNVSTLSDRRIIWRLVWERIQERPLGGYGFFIFWDIPELVADHEVLRLGSAHNSLLETGLGLGILGAVPFAVITALAAFNAGADLWRRPGADTWMWAVTVAFLLWENITESFVLWFSYNWVLLMAAALRKPRPAPVDRSYPAPVDRPATESPRPPSGRTTIGSFTTESS